MGAKVRESRHKLSHEVIAGFPKRMMEQVAPGSTREAVW